MAEEASRFLYTSTSTSGMAKAEECETERAGMGSLVGRKMGKREQETGG